MKWREEPHSQAESGQCKGPVAESMGEFEGQGGSQGSRSSRSEGRQGEEGNEARRGRSCGQLGFYSSMSQHRPKLTGEKGSDLTSVRNVTASRADAQKNRRQGPKQTLECKRKPQQYSQ